MWNEEVNGSQSFQIQSMFTVKDQKNMQNSLKNDSSENNATRNLKRNSSFKQVCQFPITLCRRSSKDFITWMNGFTVTKISFLDIIKNYYTQIQPSFVYLFVSLAVFVLALEVSLCLVLLTDIHLDAGFIFLLVTFICVCTISAQIMININRLQNKNRKRKSKEI
ncbi:hypothetical protein PGB90_000981 [Kerria lacca]